MTDKEMSSEIEAYTESIFSQVKDAYDIAQKARSQGLDPEETVDIPLAKNLSERVEGLISVAQPQIKGQGIPKRIEELEQQFGKLDWRVALSISLEVAQQKFCEFESELKAMETGIRIGIAYLTLGVVASPLEGFVELKLRKRRDNGKEYFALMYSGPIRSAGGTAGAVSVVLADYIRTHMGYAAFDPTETEVRRTVTELYDYHDRVTNLQYLPSEKELLYLVEHLPVQIDGDPSESIEVSNYKDLERIETNQIRSGICLVTGECVAQKAKKVWAQLSRWGEEFGIPHWSFMKEFLDIQKKEKAQSQDSSDSKTEEKVPPDYTFIKDLVAGRPVLTHPLAVGGFRLRYGRSRFSGYSAASIHPATMQVLSNFIGIGTQLKMERPGKAATMTPCDSVEGPVVRLHDGSVVFLDTEEKAKQYRSQVNEILFLGDMLLSFGDFFNRAHTLVPPGYCEEWWFAELVDAAGKDHAKEAIVKAGIDAEFVSDLFEKPLHTIPTFEQALLLSTSFSIPLHPRFTYHWKTIYPQDVVTLASWITNQTKENTNDKLVLEQHEEGKKVLEALGIPHLLSNNEFVVIEKDVLHALRHSLHMESDMWFEDIKKQADSAGSGLDIVSSVCQTPLKDKSGIFVGTRMGRPEKAKMRKLNGSPQMLFPVGEEGGRMRSVQATLEAGKITAEFSLKWIEKTRGEFGDDIITLSGNPQDTYAKAEINIQKYLKQVLVKTNLAIPPDLIKGVTGTSNKDHIPESLIKGILRAKNEVYVNKDGTTRYDATQLPITHFTPHEIGTSVERLQELGYTHDIKGQEFTEETQTLELKPQDMVLPACPDSPDEGADAVMFKVGRFVDDLLECGYDLGRYYNFSSKKDIAGHLVMVLAPHTSAAIVGRVIGFSQTQGLFAHPMLHAATRRDCDGDEASVSLLLDGLLNFSRQFLPNTRGATQDAPLVLTSKVIPSEVDDMIFDLDIPWSYDLDFYKSCEEYKKPWEVSVDKLGDFINTSKQYEGMGYTHSSTSINQGILCSSYKILPSMQEKLKGQMLLADKIGAVDASDVARLVIEKHLIRDIKGNLRKFSTQQFRCVKCNEKYRRPPLAGICTVPNCMGKILFTVSEGSVVKYLEPAISLAEKYDLPGYIMQSLSLTKDRVEETFGKEKERQEGLNKWFG